MRVNNIVKIVSLSALTLALSACEPAVQPKPLIAERYADNGDGTVTDILTNLTWQRCTVGQHWNGEMCEGEASSFYWDDAIALSKDGWRLPTIEELKSLVHCSSENDSSILPHEGMCRGEHSTPTIDTVAFPSTNPFPYWSSSIRYAEEGQDFPMEKYKFLSSEKYVQSFCYEDNPGFSVYLASALSFNVNANTLLVTQYNMFCKQDEDGLIKPAGLFAIFNWDGSHDSYNPKKINIHFESNSFKVGDDRTKFQFSPDGEYIYFDMDENTLAQVISHFETQKLNQEQSAIIDYARLNKRFKFLTRVKEADIDLFDAFNWFATETDGKEDLSSRWAINFGTGYIGKYPSKDVFDKSFVRLVREFQN
ncbi:DUF1566 domain-containing protein [Alkalimonas sp.]|uniref:Lcl C-terminal domain-containing protein n=1 Tax=Alkalimonas sp. TaxID=1872453 RepID=UPI00263ACC8A|nr:DUF1566 domain-containing protein [Alkalimonas sp.]MCC5827396.1 DUF1566 domain-containing protein [Alkalimonas sp.]